MLLTKNSSRNSTGQLPNYAVLGITAAACCIICLLVLVALSIYAKCYGRSTTTVKHLAVGLTVTNMVYQFVLALHLVYYFYPEVKEVKDLCKSQGFLVKYFLSVQLLLTLGICLILFLEVLKVTTSWKLQCYEKVKRSTYTCCKRKINKLEIAIFSSSFTVPLLFDWIPFTTNSYGSTEADVCWILDQNCSQHASSCTATLWEKIWLFTVPVGFVGIVIMLLFTVLLCLLIYNIKNARVDRRALIAVTVATCIFFIVFFIIIILITLLLFYYSSLMVTPFTLTFIPFTLIFTPITIMLVPLTILVAIHLPFSSMIAQMCLKHPRHRHMSGECDRATVQSSINWQQPSHTTWNSPHSSNEASEITPLISGPTCEDT